MHKIKVYKNTDLANSSYIYRRDYIIFQKSCQSRKYSLTSILGFGGSLIMYFLKRKNIPKLDFDGLWKEPNCKGTLTCYYIKVKRDKVRRKS
jgi:hypothetical protein